MSRRKYLRRLIFTLLASTAIPAVAHAVEPSGKTIRVSQDANAAGPGGTRTLSVPGDIFQGDEIVTTSNGQVQIEFADQTRFVVGRNSRVVVDEFLFQPDGTATSVTLNTLRGTFRFISGKSPKQVYEINTPTMTIGVRGTTIDLRILGNGDSLASWAEGSGNACVVPEGSTEEQRTECQDVGPGGVVGAPPGGGFASFRPGELQQRLATISPGLGPLAPGFQAGDPPPSDPSDPGGDSDTNDPPPPPIVPDAQPTYP